MEVVNKCEFNSQVNTDHILKKSTLFNSLLTVAIHLSFTSAFHGLLKRIFTLSSSIATINKTIPLIKF